ncbi:DUF1289 domain-containing protein [Alteromonas sediminis]|uniref:DUF1289 domain-containing protein n=1 Tax=Alteromonas sediminis TaxID=2259342 RepID=A0A3N5Y4D4_9ALTE|nr:DUF1289 domain-containing protein [Alteromonas sediminis]RPJ67973.1 DUF1289 domain-containing protein [Alteromonas sediminis]
MANMPSQLEMFAVPSPCIGVCQTGERGYCVGCFRSREERLYWLQVDDATKRTIIKACARRKAYAIYKQNKKNEQSEQGYNAQQDLF